MLLKIGRLRPPYCQMTPPRENPMENIRKNRRPETRVPGVHFCR